MQNREASYHTTDENFAAGTEARRVYAHLAVEYLSHQASASSEQYPLKISYFLVSAQ